MIIKNKTKRMGLLVSPKGPQVLVGISSVDSRQKKNYHMLNRPWTNIFLKDYKNPLKLLLGRPIRSTPPPGGEGGAGWGSFELKMPNLTPHYVLQFYLSYFYKKFLSVL